jgi:rfaE bifunctional protein nucleotidyltransferase chain/domain
MTNKKIKLLPELKEITDKLKAQNKKIIFTNGCFDILHIGHINLLKKAKESGDILILGLNTDNSIKQIKGPNRPITNEKNRATILSYFYLIDYIILFNELTPEKTISYLKPDAIVKGGDYDPYNYDQMPEAKIVHEYGGEVIIIETIDKEKNSSTTMIEKMKQ